MQERPVVSLATTVRNVALAFAAGALAMYLLDPNSGRRRRALIRDRGVSMGHGAERYVRGKTRRVADRLKGVAARTRASLFARAVDDVVLHDRIRARLGHLLDQPHDVDVHVLDGRVQLKGMVAEAEFKDLLRAVTTMRGVQNVESLLRTTPMPSAPRAYPGPH